ncbi:hypothetical protein C2845_PM05G22790 [Panicum miliaceum]|uniref:Uncharacterized protein n=1 Tax=Panicum miliaceum TaxID=4540 RepID=A0A3L6T4D8_PANMI|nr:hypothetical protein C2845_PM05G22790 [Panicum miliaceum]
MALTAHAQLVTADARVAGLQPALKKTSSQAETLRVQELEAQLEKEKQDKEELRQKLDGQQQEIDNLKKQSQEAR